MSISIVHFSVDICLSEKHHYYWENFAALWANVQNIPQTLLLGGIFHETSHHKIGGNYQWYVMNKKGKMLKMTSWQFGLPDNWQNLGLCTMPGWRAIIPFFFFLHPQTGFLFVLLACFWYMHSMQRGLSKDIALIYVTREWLKSYPGWTRGIIGCVIFC